jgi:acyl transferase domain-containing protein/pimeloyl-ACP methyl ester carboxylesterase/short-subunit dehydrogenase/acyl carrier protein
MSTASDPFAGLPPLQRAYLALEEMQLKLDGLERARSEPIAIVGLGCRFPGGVDGPASYWRLLRAGVDAVTEVPPERWDVNRYYDPDPAKPGKTYSRWGSFIQQADQFDPYFFGISPREAALMDPQQRLLLEVAWEALENAGLPADRLAGSQTGVFVGIYNNDYAHLQHEDDAYSAIGSSLGVASGRLSYTFDFHGPSLLVDTLCSSSLVAVHLACQSLRRQECQLALAGGVNLILSPLGTILSSRLTALSPDGRCKTFDARANGYVRGEGCGVVALKRLSDAERDGDPIWAVIRGSAVNQDGRSSGLTAPNMLAQQAVIRQALDDGAVAPEQVGYIEAHGTGTPLGDPIEVEALKAVYGQSRNSAAPCVLGSVKTNFGHLEAAAGIAGLIKAVLALHHQAIPPHLHLRQLNPRIDLQNTRLTIPTTLQAWPVAAGPRFAGVSAFGLSGTNAHIVLEEAPPAAIGDGRASSPYLLPLSARTPEALRALAERFATVLAEPDAPPLADLAAAAGSGRSHLAERAALVATNPAEALAALHALADGQSHPAVQTGRVPASAPRPRLVFVCAGQGGQWAGLAPALLADPVALAALQQVAAAAPPGLDWSLLELLGDPAAPWLERMDQLQPILFALQVALAARLQAWGVTPAAVAGHSFGEVAAAYLAGALTLPEAMRVICARSRALAQRRGQGAMALVELSGEQAEQLLAGQAGAVTVAGVNGPRSTLLAGEPAALDQVLAELAGQGVFARRLAVDVAAHSPQVEALLPGLAAELADLHPQAGRLPFYSTVSGQVTDGRELNGAYWARNLRAPVRFWAALQALVADGHTVFVELGPHPTLVAAVSDGLRALGVAGQALAALRRDQPLSETLLRALGALYCAGVALAWPPAAPGRSAAHALPTYPFQRQRCWVTPPAPTADAAPALSTGTHPLLGVSQPLATPAGAQVWRRTLERASLPLLEDHQVDGLVVLPGAAYIELFLAAMAEQGLGRTLTGVTFAQMLALPEAEQRELQTFMRPGPTTALEVWSRPVGNDHPWTRYASATVSPGEMPAANDPVVTARRVELLARCRQPLDPAGFYQALADAGLTYGPRFRGVTQLWRGEREALGRLQLPDVTAGDASAYQIHPALLDSCFQVFAAALPPEAAETGQVIYLPVGLGRLRLVRAPGASAWGHAQLQAGASDPNTYTGRLIVSDEAEQTLIEIDGFTVRRFALREAAPGRLPVDEWLYHLAWRSQPLPEPAAVPPPPAPTTWLILADDAGLGQTLAGQLAERGDRCVLVVTGQVYEQLDVDRYQLERGQPSDYRRLLTECFPPERGALHHVVYLWSLSDSTVPSVDQDPSTAVTVRCAELLFLTQALAQTGWRDAPRLWLLTRGAQAVEPAPGAVALVGAALWGLANNIALEQPELACTRIDLSPQPLPDEIYALLREFTAGAEDRVALRPGGRYVARLTRGLEDSPASSAASLAPAGEQPFRLEIETAGLLNGLTLRAMQRRAPGRGEVEMAVETAGLNFLDVLGALAARPDSVSGPPALGGECAGRITAVGEGVIDLRLGDAVVALAPWSFGTHVTTAAAFVVPKPAQLSFAEAATIPIAFLTAYYALHELAHLQPGERVLIHSAATGTGLAALQIAQRAGAEVFATAGSADKRAFLQTLGVTHIADSRSLSFADAFQAATGGQGVDVVLNALSGPAVERSLALLAPYGRFLEMGKRDIYQNAQIGLAPFKNSLSYFAVDLLGLALRRPAQVAALLRQVMTLFAQGELRPLPLTTYPIAQAVEAFHTMAQAQHLGKLVLTLAERATTAIAPRAGGAVIRADGSYLITGGLGGLGLQVAGWLAAQGARHLALLGRSAPTPKAAQAIEALRAGGAQVLVLQADVAVAAQLAAALDQLRLALPPLRGVVHAAAVLDDGFLLQLTPERLAAVLAPKVAGAWNLHTLTRGDPLGDFVLCSSAAGMLGSPGQGHYAAANTFLDALAYHRRGHGLPALSINWGPWSEVGLAAAQTNRGQRLAAQGLASLRPAEGLAALAYVLRQTRPLVAVMKFDVRRWSQLFPQAAELPLLRELVAGLAAGVQPRAAASPARAALFAAAPEARRALLIQHLIEQIAQVLRADPARISPETPMPSMGMDSLMALELRNRLELSLGLSLPATLVWGRPTVVDLVPDLAERLGLSFDHAQPDAPPAPLRISVGELTERVEPAAAGVTMAESFVDVRGMRLCVCNWGPAEGQPVLCLHGMLDHGASWERVAAHLARRGLRVLAPDLRGHGRSAHLSPGSAYHLTDMRGDMDGLLEAYGPRRPVLVGHSLGAALAGLLATERPERFAGLVLVEPPSPAQPDRATVELLALAFDALAELPSHPTLPSVQAAAERLRQSLPALSPEWALRMAVRLTEPYADGVRWRWDPVLRAPGGLVFDVNFAAAGADGRLNHLPPTIVIYGDGPDSLAGRAPAGLNLPGARRVTLPGSHTLLIDAPEALADLIYSLAA